MVILLFETDIGKMVGLAIRRETSIQHNLISLDELQLEEGDWIVVAGQAGLKDQVALRQTETEDAPDASMDPAPVQQ